MRDHFILILILFFFTGFLHGGGSMNKATFIKNWLAKKSPLPSDVIPLKYLESTGEQWIDTGINAQSGLILEASIKSMDNKQCRIIAASDSINRLGILFSSAVGDIVNQYGTINKLTGYIVDENIHTIKNDNGTLYYDNNIIDVEEPQIFNINRNLYIFSSNNIYTPVYSYIKIYAVKVLYSNKNIIRNFIPCLFPTDTPCIDGNTLQTVTPSADKPGMYDTVSGHFFVNQGTGTDFLYELA